MTQIASIFGFGGGNTEPEAKESAPTQSQSNESQAEYNNDDFVFPQGLADSAKFTVQILAAPTVKDCNKVLKDMRKQGASTCFR